MFWCYIGTLDKLGAHVTHDQEPKAWGVHKTNNNEYNYSKQQTSSDVFYLFTAIHRQLFSQQAPACSRVFG